MCQRCCGKVIFISYSPLVRLFIYLFIYIKGKGKEVYLVVRLSIRAFEVTKISVVKFLITWIVSENTEGQKKRTKTINSII